MTLKPGQIIKNLIPGEPVTIDKVQELGSMFSITYTGINSKKQNTKIVDPNDLEQLEEISLDGAFNFKGNPERFLLFAEAERINSAYQFDPLFAVNCSVIDPLPHQVEAVYKYLLPLPQIRFLLADDTGAGKTIMTGLLIKEMIMRGFLDRILIVTPGGLTKQWQEDEMAIKFNLPFKLVDRGAFNSDPNIFTSSNRLITSIDFIRNEDVLNVVNETTWDMIVVDEAHKLSAYEYGRRRYKSKRYEAMEAMAKKCEHLLLLTATPHRGRRDTFKYLLQLLDDDIFASDNLVTSRVNEISEEGVNKFFIRRLKEEMKDWEGNPLFKKRFTRTVQYEMTPEEKKLYLQVTKYLLKRRHEARIQSNQHVSLALMVMQRRLTSSIYAIMKTLKNRYKALEGILDELSKNPGLFDQRYKIDIETTTIEDYDELDDDERESLENILSDPKQFRLFTTAQSKSEIQQEAREVSELVDMAENLYRSNQEEQKFKKLRELLRNEGVLDEQEKLVIFTEHVDTLKYLTQRLENNGYIVSNIHGGMSVDERRVSQNEFARESQILVATDAAGEGINLQFCRLLINWDIPWNPNRLEQRMGRIHRYGQKQDVIVFNMVAQNTREGKVLQRLLEKLDLIREQMGDDRVYDVISDIFENVNLEDIINSTFDGEETSYDDAIDRDLTEENVRTKIKDQRERMGHSLVDYARAQELKEQSDERRLQPIYIRMFFEKALKMLGGEFREERDQIFKIEKLPDIIEKTLREKYNISTDIRQLYFCFDKQIFLEEHQFSDLGSVHYINPGNPVFDSVVQVIRENFREDMLKGTVLVSPDDNESYYAFYAKSQISDNRPHKEKDSIADERIVLIQMNEKGKFSSTSPAKFIDLSPPKQYAKTVEPPDIIDQDKVQGWSFENITKIQFKETKMAVEEDAKLRKEYLEEAFTNVIMDLTEEINDLQQMVLTGNEKVQDQLEKAQDRMNELKEKKVGRLQQLEQMQQLHMKPPEVMGSAYVLPLNEVEYKNHFGMSRDDEVEAIAMKTAMDFEKNHGWKPEDVSANNMGYDIRSVNSDMIKRYIEVKGRSAEGAVMISENEMNRLSQLGEKAWLYIVTNCKTDPKLHRIPDPAHSSKFKKLTKGVQYLLRQEEWSKSSI